MLDDIDFYKKFYVLFEREKGLPQIRVTDLRTEKSRHIEFPEPAYTVYAGANASTTQRNFAIATSPLSLRLPFLTTMLRVPQVLCSRSGKFPAVTIAPVIRWKEFRHCIRRRENSHLRCASQSAKLDGKGPIYLTGYGSYGAPYDISFDSPIFSMVDRGVVVAVAHIRGGGEMAKPGTMMVA